MKSTYFIKGKALGLILAIYLISSLVQCQSNSTNVDNVDTAQNIPSSAAINNNALTENLQTEPTQEKYTLWNSFISGFSIIFIAEIGDRTFILIMIYAVTNNYLKTFLISNFVLLLWNYISIMIGYNIPFLIKKELVEWVGIFTFTGFGIKMIYDGYYMESIFIQEEYEQEEQNLIKEQHDNQAKVHSSDCHSHGHSASRKNSAGYITNDNDLKENLLNSNKINLKKTDIENNKSKNYIEEEKNLFSSFWAFAFSLIMAELGDKSQISAVVIGATHNFYGVLIGTSLAHSLCTIIAIVFGKIFSRYVTTRQITIIGGFIFLIFAAFFLIGKF